MKIPKNIALIVIDIDGTLLDSENRISRGAEDMIQKAIARGVHISLCSGRGNPRVKPFVRRLSLQHPYIVSGGAAIMAADGATVLEQYPLTFEQMQGVEIIGKQANCGMLAHTTEFLYGELHSDIWERMSKWEWVRGESNPPIQRVENISTVFHLPIIRMDYFAPHEILDELRHAAANTGLTAIRLTNNVEISAKGVDKGSALLRLANLLKVPIEQVLAVGDGVNDEPMLIAAGVGVALGNGAVKALNAANLVAPSNDEGGLAWTIQEVLK